MDQEYKTNDDLFHTILHEIRNMKQLTPEMMRNIRDMSTDRKMEIIQTYQEVIEVIQTMIDR
jgi:hypothetical protein